ncbi:MAG: family 10 glycosylhydrolase, partial [Planctomycetota bacterium]
MRRTPGDILRVSFPRDSLVFSPGEVFKFTVQPHLLPLPRGSKVKIKTRLVSAGDQQEFRKAEHDAWAGQPVAIPRDVRLPQQEGVYELIITATHKPNLQEAIRKPLNWNKPEIERKVQFLVLSPDRPIPSTEAGGVPKQVGKDIDPANPGWQQRLAKLPQSLKLPRLLKGSLGNGNMKIWRHPRLGEVARLNPNRESPDVSWEAYTLPISQPGRPHVLEVEYPSDVPQTMGISVLEPNAAGALMPIGLDSGIDATRAVLGNDEEPCWLRHRLIFWPRTATPVVLITNLRDHSPAVYGKIRVLAGWEHLPRGFPADPQQSDRPPHTGRSLLAYLDRPLFPENFSAAESLDSWGRSLDDWQTFHQSGTRLVEYLHHVGYGGLMISVLADGSTIYPSRILQPTPRYDTGVLFDTAQDPVRKDVLEMLFRLCDREGLQLIPTIEFAAPLPELEAIRRAGGPGSEAIEWIGPDGATRCRHHPTRRGLCPYYNVLEPRVQGAMLKVIRELVERYADHPSFAGLAIQLSADGYAQLPGPQWGMDDATIARFQRHAKLQVPGTGPERFAQRARFLHLEEHHGKWLQWRAGELSRFYRTVRAELTAARQGSRLYLAGGGALAGPALENDLRPALPRTMTIADALLRVGIDARHYRDDEGIVLLRGERITPGGRLGAQAIDLEINQMSDVDDY